MKAFKMFVLIIGGLFMLTACNQSDINAVVFDSKDIWVDTLETVELSPKETNPVFKKNEQLEYEIYMTLVDKDTLDPEVPLIEKPRYKYVVQLASVTDRERLASEQERLGRQGYETNISKRYSNGIAYYRLRLNGEYTETEAKEFGKEIVKRFLNIKDYLVLRVN